MPVGYSSVRSNRDKEAHLPRLRLLGSKPQPYADQAVMGAEVHGQSFPVIVGREVPVLSEEKNFGVEENLSTTEKLMPQGAGRIKIFVVSSCNVGVQQSSVGPADTYSDVRSDLFT